MNHEYYIFLCYNYSIFVFLPCESVVPQEVSKSINIHIFANADNYLSTGDWVPIQFRPIKPWLFASAFFSEWHLTRVLCFAGRIPQKDTCILPWLRICFKLILSNNMYFFINDLFSFGKCPLLSSVRRRSECSHSGPRARLCSYRLSTRRCVDCVNSWVCLPVSDWTCSQNRSLYIYACASNCIVSPLIDFYLFWCLSEMVQVLVVLHVIHVSRLLFTGPLPPHDPWSRQNCRSVAWYRTEGTHASNKHTHRVELISFFII